MNISRNCDTELGEKTGWSNNSNSPIVWNSQFSDSKSLLEEALADRGSTRIRYRSEENKRLMERAKAHIAEHRTELQADSVIVLVHPFFMSLSHMYAIIDSNRDDANRYCNNLVRLLNAELPKSKVNIVVMETLHHYAAATSRLLEIGVIDYVVLTKTEEGHPLDRKDMAFAEDRTVFIGGGYVGCCLKAGASAVRDVKRSLEGICAIRDLCIKLPHYNHHCLIPKRVETTRGHIKDYTITDQVIELFGQ